MDQGGKSRATRTTSAASASTPWQSQLKNKTSSKISARNKRLAILGADGWEVFARRIKPNYYSFTCWLIHIIIFTHIFPSISLSSSIYPDSHLPIKSPLVMKMIENIVNSFLGVHTPSQRSWAEAVPWRRRGCARRSQLTWWWQILIKVIPIIIMMVMAMIE